MKSYTLPLLLSLCFLFASCGLVESSKCDAPTVLQDTAIYISSQPVDSVTAKDKRYRHNILLKAETRTTEPDSTDIDCWTKATAGTVYADRILDSTITL